MPYTVSDQQWTARNNTPSDMDRYDLTQNQIITNDPNFAPDKRYYLYSTLRDRRKIMRAKEDSEEREVVPEIETVL